MALLGAVIWLAVGRLIRPVEQTALAIVQKTPEDLTPVAVAEPPLELSPIIDSLNTVFARLDKALQRSAVSLPTPLTSCALRWRRCVHEDSATGAPAPEHQSSLRMLRDDADRCTALAENLLALARLDADRPDLLAREPVALPALLEELRRSYAAQAEARQIDLVIDCRVASLYGNAELLRVALRNLLDNALRYCPSHSRVIEAQSSAQSAPAVRRWSRVPEPLRGRLAERFFRACTDQTGSGLGLSIVNA